MALRFMHLGMKPAAPAPSASRTTVRSKAPETITTGSIG
jgi:hypothetical protein